MALTVKQLSEVLHECRCEWPNYFEDDNQCTIIKRITPNLRLGMQTAIHVSVEGLRGP